MPGLNRLCLAIAFGLASLFLGCKGPQPPAPRPVAAAREGAEPERRMAPPGEVALRTIDLGDQKILARFEGREISAQEFVDWMFRERRREAIASLSRMVNEEIADREAQKLGIRLDERMRGELAARAVEEAEREAALAYGLGTSIERYARLRYGESEAEHLQRRTREALRRELYGRLIRWRALQEGRVTLRMISCQREEDAREVQKALEGGADFARLADRYSVHESAREGGLLAPLSPSGLHPAVAARISRMAEGEASGPLLVHREGEAPSWQIVKVERREAPVRGPYEAHAAQIQEELKARPIDVIEWTSWSLAMEALYGVRLSDRLPGS